AAVASCSAVDMVSILKKSRVPFESFHVAIEGKRAEGVPSPFTEIELHFHIATDISHRKKVERAVSLAVEKYCSVSAMLEPDVKILHKTILSEDSSLG
ncbi:MAG: OsmC family protein, partial [Okeania sp. SIO1H5]|uniref:OsmC family protein n=1 Tax=Okeania sp. SIO1H5 TaxID=2607777 RepID=UPI0013BB673F